MNQPWVYMRSPSWTPLPPPSPSHPSGSSLCTNPEHLSHLSNLGWWSVSYLIIYMFRYCSFKTSHPRLLPRSPKVCSIHLRLFFCFAYRVIVTIFLNSIYMCYYTVLVFIFLAYFTLCNGLQFHPSHQNWFKWILFNGWVIFHSVYVPQLPYPSVCWWASRLLPCPGYYRQCCDEHWGTCVSFISGFLSIYAQEWDCWVIWQFYFQFFKKSPKCSPKQLY